jgi:hypothetical protein
MFSDVSNGERKFSVTTSRDGGLCDSFSGSGLALRLYDASNSTYAAFPPPSIVIIAIVVIIAAIVAMVSWFAVVGIARLSAEGICIHVNGCRCLSMSLRLRPDLVVTRLYPCL